MAKKRKIKKFYTIAVTSDYSCDKTKYYRSRFNVFRLTISLALIVVLLGVGLTVFEFYELDNMESKIRVFKGIIAEQETTIDRLGREKAELTSENEVLNSTVARALIEDEKNAEEERLKHLPTGFPLTGSAHIVEPEDFFKEELDEVSAYYEKILAAKKKEEEKDVEKDPYVFFAMSEISDVVAVADGTVISVSDDSTYGKCIKIDHGNGYISIYKNSGDPKVSEGDSVIRGAIIFVGGETNNFLEYQLTLDGVYVDPMESMSING